MAKPRRRQRRPGRRSLLALAAVIALAVGWRLARRPQPAAPPPPPAPAPASVSAPAGAGRLDDPAIEAFCTQCHGLALPAYRPKKFWPSTIDQMYDHLNLPQGQALSGGNIPERETVRRYYVDHAPEALALPALPPDTPQSRFRPHAVAPHVTSPQPGVSWFGWSPDATGYFADMRGSWVYRWRWLAGDAVLEPLFQAANPARLQQCDLDRDGRRDFLVAELGSFMPTDDPVGKVVWLRGTDTDYERVELASQLGRVADVATFDLDGDGNLDILAAVFGWRIRGQLLILEQLAGKPAREWLPHAFDQRVGLSQLAVADLNNDGHRDIVAMLSQHYEKILAFVSGGDGGFTPVELFDAGRPDYGMSSLCTADLDGDGDIDVVFTNGDAMDLMITQPHHGINWLENRDGQFVYHRLLALPGAYGAATGDLDGDGDLDIAAIAWVPMGLRDDAMDAYNDRRQYQFPAVLWLEQTPTGFVAQVLEREHCDHAVVAVHDVDGDGRLDIVVGEFSFAGLTAPAPPAERAFTIWFNSGP